MKEYTLKLHIQDNTKNHLITKINIINQITLDLMVQQDQGLKIDFDLEEVKE